MQQVYQRMFRLSLSGSLLALLVLLTFNVGTTHAATCQGLATTETNPSCQIVVPSITTSAGALTYSADAGLTVSNLTGTAPAGSSFGTLSGASGGPYTYTSNGKNQIFGISFHTAVFDNRDGIAGWSLEASTTITSGTIVLGTSTATCTSIVNATPTCSPTNTALSTATPTLNGTPKPFVGALDGGPTNVGDYSIITPGTLTLPYNLAAGTAVTGNITITLSNIAFV